VSGPSLTVVLTGESVPDDPWWVRIEQLPVAEDAISIGDAAEFLDAAYGRDPCGRAPVEEPAEEPDAEDVTEAAQATFDPAICSVAPDGTVEVGIKIIRSHRTEPYRIHVAGGEITATVVVQEEIALSQAVEQSSRLTLEYPVLSGRASWFGPVVGLDGRAPEIERHGNTLYWRGQVSGVISARILTVYDLVTVRIPGNGGEQGQATVRAVFHGLVDDMVPEMPAPADQDRSLCPSAEWQLDGDRDRITCYQDVQVHVRCSCSRREIDFFTEQVVVPCPEGMIRCPNMRRECMALLGTTAVDRYVECANDNALAGSGGGLINAVSSPEYYRELCCRTPPNNLPQCEEKISTYRGGAEVKPNKQHYLEQYGPDVRLVPVAPPGGICGQHIVKQVFETTGCCNGIEPPVWDFAHSVQVLGAGASGIVFWSASRGPYRVRIEGTGFYLDSRREEKTLRTPSHSAMVYTAGKACGSGAITVTDACGHTVVGSVRATDGGWVLISTELPRNTVPGCAHPYEFSEIIYTTCYSSNKRYDEMTQWHRAGPGNCLPSSCPPWTCDPGRACQVLWERRIYEWQC
jgi:hypothetical protein